MGYYIDLANMTLDEYKNKLSKGYLPPSRMILKENMEERFNELKKQGIQTVKELMALLKTEVNLIELSKIDCLSGDYLKLLLREMKSTLPKPKKINEFNSLAPETISILESKGLKNTLKVFNRVSSEKEREELSKETEIKKEEILKLTKLTDLSRIRFCGPAFAQMLLELEMDTVEKIAKADPKDLHTKINELNNKKEIYKAEIGFADIEVFVKEANEVPLDIEY